jgi:hypothetical protein
MIIGDYSVKPMALNVQVLLVSQITTNHLSTLHFRTTTKGKRKMPNHIIQQLYTGAISSQTKPMQIMSRIQIKKVAQKSDR